VSRFAVLVLLALALCASTLGAASAQEPDRGPRSALGGPVPAENGGPCGNERFRTLRASEGLPDCRAYEQVTPLDKSGIDTTGTVPFAKAALNGGAVTFLSSVNSSALQEYTPSLAIRGGGTWSSEDLLPSPQRGQRPEVIGLTPDLSEAFVQVNVPGETPAAALLGRSAPGGALSTLVPLTTKLKARFVGASEDVSLVVFESPAALPASGPAIPGGPNLYAWDRPSGQVRLVGVLNDGRAPPEGAFGGSYDWVLGTALGEGGAARDYYTQDQHVVSTNGSAVYFTAAGTGQLYLRRNPSSAQSPLAGGRCVSAVLACTVEVSASRRTDGATPGGLGVAAFMGASADGSKAFFTSPNELTDDANTGAEPHPSRIARAGIDGSPGSVESDFLRAPAAGIAVDSSHLYWADQSRGSIGRARLDGSGIEEDFVAGLVRPGWVAVDDEYVYWTSPGGAGKPGEGSIGRARLDGDAPEPSFIVDAGKPQGIAVNGARVFWANDGPHAIGRANIDGSGVEPLFHPLGNAEIPQGVAVDGSHVYWTVNEPVGYVSRSDLDGSHETFRFIGATDELRGVAVDGQHVYWAARRGGTIGRANLDLGEIEPRFIPAADRATGIAVDGLHLHWSIAGTGRPGNDLYSYDADSEELVDLAPDTGEADGAGVKGVLGISEDGSYVYFAANGILANAPNGRGETALPGNCKGNLGSTSGSCNLYAFHDGTIDFIAGLEIDGGAAESDASNWAATPTGVFDAPDFQQTARVSADGRTLLFRSQRSLTGYVSEGTPELYRYHVGDPELTCVSCDPSGAAPVGPPTFGTIAPPTGFRRPSAVLTRNLSASGDRVFFESVDALVEADRNGEEGCPLVGFPERESPACQDVYEWEAEGSGSCESAAANGGCLYLLSAGQPGQPAFFADASIDGEDAFLFTSARLVGQDLDELVDVYDARVGGGLEAQGEVPADCEGEGCRGPAPSTRPAEVEIGTAAPARHRPHRRIRRCSKRVRHATKRHCGKHTRNQK
jgi:hypothetical protein